MSHRWGLLVLLACFGGCRTLPPREPLVGTWLVRMPDAPFPMHMFAFHGDGTVQQSNPDAGDARHSDSNLLGAWRVDGPGYRGRLVEVTADRATGRFAGRVEISFVLTVRGDALRGTATAAFFDADGASTGSPVQVAMTGQRVVP